MPEKLPLRHHDHDLDADMDTATTVYYMIFLYYLQNADNPVVVMEYLQVD